MLYVEGGGIAQHVTLTILFWGFVLGGWVVAAWREWVMGDRLEAARASEQRYRDEWNELKGRHAEAERAWQDGEMIYRGEHVVARCSVPREILRADGRLPRVEVPEAFRQAWREGE